MSDPHNLTKVDLVALITLLYFDAFFTWLLGQQKYPGPLLLFSSTRHACLVSTVFLLFRQTSARWNGPWMNLWYHFLSSVFIQSLLFSVSQL